MIAADGIPEGFRPPSPKGSLRKVWEQMSLGTPDPNQKRKGPLISRPAGLCCNPAEVQTSHPPNPEPAETGSLPVGLLVPPCSPSAVPFKRSFQRNEHTRS